MSGTPDKTAQVLNELERIVRSMDTERRRKFVEWLEVQNRYLQWEQGFDPKMLRRYSRGEIVLAHFGFNTGAEFGGMHFAVVIENNAKSAGSVMVIPLSSLDESETETDVNRNEVYLGTIQGLNDKQSFAVVSQMRPISKLRVYKPRKQSDSVLTLSSAQMDKLDLKIGKRFTKLKFGSPE
ncbi:MAG: type II toxin-antitoxin system PemK/MazF family toxin [Firmicutes bacterium]|nr:type II toxin-antitoxin system PemK/MazF family toxin [Bacillota bacterium]